MAGLKTFANNELLTAGDVNGYLMNQVVARVADQSERDALIIPELGQTIERLDLNIGERWDGSAWRKTPLRFTGLKLVKNIAQGWATADTKVPWRTDKVGVLDTHNFYDTALNTRFTMPFAGWYRFNYSMTSSGIIATAATLYINNAARGDGVSSDVGAAGAGTNVKNTVIYAMNAGDYIELVIRSASTGSGAWSAGSCWFEIEYLGEF